MNNVLRCLIIRHDNEIIVHFEIYYIARINIFLLRNVRKSQRLEVLRKFCEIYRLCRLWNTSQSLTTVLCQFSDKHFTFKTLFKCCGGHSETVILFWIATYELHKNLIPFFLNDSLQASSRFSSFLFAWLIHLFLLVLYYLKVLCYLLLLYVVVCFHSWYDKKIFTGASENIVFCGL